MSLCPHSVWVSNVISTVVCIQKMFTSQHLPHFSGLHCTVFKDEYIFINAFLDGYINSHSEQASSNTHENY